MQSCRLIYKSIANSTVINSATLIDLEHQATENNKKHNICGILIYSDNKFIQVLEGEPKYVKKLYSNITKDERHHDVELIIYTDINKPEFTDWSMKLVNFDELNNEYKEMLEYNAELMLTEKLENALEARREIRNIIKRIENSREYGHSGQS